VEAAKRWTLRRYYDAAFVGGSVHRDYLKKLGMPEHRIWQPYDVVDNEHFAEIADEARVNPERWRRELDLPKHYFLYVGRFSPEKNLLGLLRAYALYSEKCDAAWPLVMVGDGPQRSELERVVSSAGHDRVFLRPFQQIRTLPIYYALASCFILASTVDPWGLVVNEAMACGLPVLVSRLCGAGFDLIEEGQNGFRFDPNEAGTLAELLARMSSLENSERERMSAHSRRIVAGFTPEVWAKQLAECIGTVAAGET
jgi:glycosyltransferase involved in cell wall biosynthesis